MLARANSEAGSLSQVTSWELSCAQGTPGGFPIFFSAWDKAKLLMVSQPTGLPALASPRSKRAPILSARRFNLLCRTTPGRPSKPALMRP